MRPDCVLFPNIPSDRYSLTYQFLMSIESIISFTPRSPLGNGFSVGRLNCHHIDSERAQEVIVASALIMDIT